MLNDICFRFYYKMQGIKSAKMIAKLERVLSTALQNKTNGFLITFTKSVSI